MNGNTNMKDFLIKAIEEMRDTRSNEIKLNLKLEDENLDVSFLLRVTKVNGATITSDMMKEEEND